MISLQMGRDEPDAALERLQRHARLYTDALDAAPNGDAVISIERTQQGGFPGAIAPVDDPALPRAYFERNLLQRAVLIQIDGRLGQPHEETVFARARRALRARLYNRALAPPP